MTTKSASTGSRTESRRHRHPKHNSLSNSCFEVFLESLMEEQFIIFQERLSRFSSIVTAINSDVYFPSQYRARSTDYNPIMRFQGCTGSLSKSLCSLVQLLNRVTKMVSICKFRLFCPIDDVGATEEEFVDMYAQCMFQVLYYLFDLVDNILKKLSITMNFSSKNSAYRSSKEILMNYRSETLKENQRNNDAAPENVSSTKPSTLVFPSMEAINVSPSSEHCKIAWIHALNMVDSLLQIANKSSTEMPNVSPFARESDGPPKFDELLDEANARRLSMNFPTVSFDSTPTKESLPIRQEVQMAMTDAQEIRTRSNPLPEFSHAPFKRFSELLKPNKDIEELSLRTYAEQLVDHILDSLKELKIGHNEKSTSENAVDKVLGLTHPAAELKEVNEKPQESRDAVNIEQPNDVVPQQVRNENISTTTTSDIDQKLRNRTQPPAVIAFDLAGFSQSITKHIIDLLGNQHQAIRLDEVDISAFVAEAFQASFKGYGKDEFQVAIASKTEMTPTKMVPIENLQTDRSLKQMRIYPVGTCIADDPTEISKFKIPTDCSKDTRRSTVIFERNDSELDLLESSFTKFDNSKDTKSTSTNSFFVDDIDRAYISGASEAIDQAISVCSKPCNDKAIRSTKATPPSVDLPPVWEVKDESPTSAESCDIENTNPSSTSAEDFCSVREIGYPPVTSFMERDFESCANANINVVIHGSDNIVLEAYVPAETKMLSRKGHHKNGKLSVTPRKCPQRIPMIPKTLHVKFDCTAINKETRNTACHYCINYNSYCFKDISRNNYCKQLISDQAPQYLNTGQCSQFLQPDKANLPQNVVEVREVVNGTVYVYTEPWTTGEKFKALIDIGSEEDSFVTIKNVILKSAESESQLRTQPNHDMKIFRIPVQTSDQSKDNRKIADSYLASSWTTEQRLGLKRKKNEDHTFMYQDSYFQKKRTMFLGDLKKAGYKSGPPLVLKICRNNLLTEAYQTLMCSSRIPLNYYKRIFVFFKDEEGREEKQEKSSTFFCHLSNELFSSSGLHLFESGYGESDVLHLNPASCAGGEMFQFAGVTLGLALIHNIQLGKKLSVSLYKCLLDRPFTYHDVKEIDALLYQKLKWLKQNRISNSNVNINFTVKDRTKWGTNIKDLVCDGRHVQVTDANKAGFIELAVTWKIAARCFKQLNDFRRGLSMVLEPCLMSIFTAEELQYLMARSREFCECSSHERLAIARRSTW